MASNANFENSNVRHSLRYRPVGELTPNAKNPRKHSRDQIWAIAKSIESFGFNAPILTDGQGKIVAGHARLEAARVLGLHEVPVISLDDLTPAQTKAYMLADNKLNDRSTFDLELVALQLKELSEMALDFNLEDTGFELPEIDLLIQGLDGQPKADRADEFALASGPAVTRPGDLWQLSEHRLLCGNALDPETYVALLGNQRAAAVFSDPPYNVKIAGHVSGNGAVTHREFAMAAGEMTPEAFTTFLASSLALSAKHTSPGGLLYACMDWRHMGEMLSAGRSSQLDLINLCVWVKTNPGMGSFYRSQHELVFVFHTGGKGHRNNIQLGRFGRNRSNVWTYPGATSFAGKRGENTLSLHPTVKPIAMVADALLDATSPKDLLLDPFMGSGTAILAAERTRRRAYGIELDPLYVDTAIRRWQDMTGKVAALTSGETFTEVAKARLKKDE